MRSDYNSVSDDILKPNIRNARLKATEFWNKFCFGNIPVQMNDLVRELGINVRAAEISVEGYTRTENGIFCVLYNQDSSVVRQRFTVAHEIGHIALEHLSIFGDCNQYSHASQEIEANAFAGELLVPSEDLKKFIKGPTRNLQDVIDRYWISKDVAIIAIENNRLLNKITIPSLQNP